MPDLSKSVALQFITSESSMSAHGVEGVWRVEKEESGMGAAREADI